MTERGRLRVRRIARNLLVALGGVVVALVVLVIIDGRWWLAGGGTPLTRAERDRLAGEGAAAVESRDVPVGAMLLYGDSVIGAGHNTVRRDANAGGHAEINAISDAIRRLGYDRFMKLGKDSLVMLSTFEPCLMCRGALLEYGIRHVQFVKGKSVWSWLREDLRTLRYQWQRTQRDGGELQDSLFRLYYQHESH